MRKQIYLIHKWLGLALSLLFLLQAVSGCALVFRPQIQQAFMSDVPGEADVSLTDLDVILGQASEIFPAQPVERVLMPGSAAEPLVLRLSPGAGPRFVAVGQAEGIVFEPLPVHTVMLALFDWHEALWMGRTGYVVVTALGLCLVGFLISGLYFWWPLRARQGLRIKWRGTRVRRWYDVHRVLGVVTAPLLLLTVCTGLVMLVRMLGAAAPVPGQDDPVYVSPSVLPSIIEKHEPGSCAAGCRRIKEIRLNRQGRADFLLFSDDAPWPGAVDRLSVYADGRPPALRLSAEVSGTAVVLGWMYPLHSGAVGNTLGRVLPLISGLALGGLVVAGWFMWLARNTVRRKNKLP